MVGVAMLPTINSARGLDMSHTMRSRAQKTRGPRQRSAFLIDLLGEAGVEVNGDHPWDVQVVDGRVGSHVARRGMTGLGEAYVEGWWECAALDQFFERIMRAGLPTRMRRHPRVLLTFMRNEVMNVQSRSRAFRNGRAHYARGNDLFCAMLDRRLAYSCGYWMNASNLDDAQEAKLDLVCRKLGLRPGMRLLDIGCGWGSLVRHAADRFGVRAVGITVADEQVTYARDACRGLDVEVRLQDYRELDEQFDRIASIGMFEHVGPKNYRGFMRVARRCLAEDGLFLLHTIGTRDSFPNPTRSELDWVERNIFPGAVMPSMKQIGAALDGVFVTEDVENFGADYDPTLMAWHANFDAAWADLAPKYGERFRRMWRYYLLSCAGAFRSRAYQVWQFALSPRGVPGGYQRTRQVSDTAQESERRRLQVRSNGAAEADLRMREGGSHAREG